MEFDDVISHETTQKLVISGPGRQPRTKIQNGELKAEIYIVEEGPGLHCGNGREQKVFCNLDSDPDGSKLKWAARRRVKRLRTFRLQASDVDDRSF